MSRPSKPSAGGIDIGMTRLASCEHCCARHCRQHGQELGAGQGFRLAALPDAPRRP